MSKRVVRNHNLRREIAEYILNCSDDELLDVLYALEKDSISPKFFSCEKCKELFGHCDKSGVELCKSRILKYEEMRDNG